MENKCTNMEIGIHLHAYEISALNEEMTAEFETHLLSCKSCFKSVQEFEIESIILKNGNLILGELNSATLKNNKSIWHSFTAPTIVLALIIMLMIYPTFLGLTSMTSSSVRSVNSIILVPVRSADNNFLINHENDIVLSFRYPDCNIQKEYQIEIYSGKKLIFTVDSFKDFDSYQTGRLLIPKASLVSGSYQCILKENKNILQEYDFRII